MGEKKQERVTSDGYEEAYYEAAIFLFEQYKKYKQSIEVDPPEVT